MSEVLNRVVIDQTSKINMQSCFVASLSNQLLYLSGSRIRRLRLHRQPDVSVVGLLGTEFMFIARRFHNRLLHVIAITVSWTALAHPVTGQSPGETPPAAARTIQAAQDAARYYPLDTLAVLRWQDFNQFREGWKHSSFGMQVRDPALQGFFSSVFARISEVKKSLRLDLIDIAQQVDGEISVAAIKNQQGTVSVLAVAHFRDEEAIARFVQRLEGPLLEENAELTEMELALTKLKSWRQPSNGQSNNLNFFVQGRQFVLGSDMQTLAEAAGRTQQAGKQLADQAEYQHVMSRISGTAAGMNWFVNPTAIVRFAATSNLNGSSPAIDRLIDHSGIDQLRGVGGSLWLGQGGMDSVSTVYGHVQTPLSGILKSLVLPATTQRPPDWVKENVSIYAQINWSVDRFVDSIQQIVDHIHGPGSFDEAIGTLPITADGTKLVDVARSLSGPLHIASHVPQSADQLLSQKLIVGIGLRDPKLFRQMLRQTASKSQYLTQTIGDAELIRIRLNLSDELIDSLRLPQLELAIAVTDQALLFSPNPDYLAEAVRGSKYLRPLAEAEDYQKIASQFPKHTSMISFQRQDGQLEGLYELLRGSSGLNLSAYTNDLFDFDFQSLPPFQYMTKYLQTTGSFIMPEQDGFRIVNIALPPSGR